MSQNLGSRWERQTKGFNKCWANMDEEGSQDFEGNQAVTLTTEKGETLRFPFPMEDLWSAYCDHAKRII